MYWSCCTSFPPKLKERDWKIRSTKVDAGNLKHELLNGLWSILAVNVLKWAIKKTLCEVLGWIYLSWDVFQWWVLVHTVLKIWAAQTVGNMLTGWGAVQFTRTQLCVVCMFNILSHVVYGVGGWESEFYFTNYIAICISLIAHVCMEMKVRCWLVIGTPDNDNGSSVHGIDHMKWKGSQCNVTMAWNEKYTCIGCREVQWWCHPQLLQVYSPPFLWILVFVIM
jgi:hypothetical protein